MFLGYGALTNVGIWDLGPPKPSAWGPTCSQSVSHVSESRDGRDDCISVVHITKILTFGGQIVPPSWKDIFPEKSKVANFGFYFYDAKKNPEKRVKF